MIAALDTPYHFPILRTLRRSTFKTRFTTVRIFRLHIRVLTIYAPGELYACLRLKGVSM